MSKHTFDTTYETSGRGADVRIFYDFTPGDPGVLAGPLENSYPPSDPEVEFDRVQILNPDGTHHPATEEIVAWAKEWTLANPESLIEKAAEDLAAHRDRPDE